MLRLPRRLRFRRLSKVKVLDCILGYSLTLQEIMNKCSHNYGCCRLRDSKNLDFAANCGRSLIL